MAGVKSKAKKSAGTLLKKGDGVTPTEGFATIGDVINIKHSGAKFDEIETTQYNSPTDANGSLIKEFVFGTKDPGSVDLELSYTAQDTQDLLEAAEGKAVNFELHFPQLTSVTNVNGVKKTFNALVGAFSLNPDLKSVIKATLTLRITGPITTVALP